MATFTITVTQNISRPEKPVVINSIDDSCKTERIIEIPVPTGQSRHVTVIYNGVTPGGGSSITETITTDTTYTLIIDADNTTGTTFFGEALIFARLTASSPIYYSNRIERNHSNNIC